MSKPASSIAQTIRCCVRVPENASRWPPGLSTRRTSAQNSAEKAVSPVSHCSPMKPAAVREYGDAPCVSSFLSIAFFWTSAGDELPNRLMMETRAYGGSIQAESTELSGMLFSTSRQSPSRKSYSSATPRPIQPGWNIPMMATASQGRAGTPGNVRDVFYIIPPCSESIWRWRRKKAKPVSSRDSIGVVRASRRAYLVSSRLRFFTSAG
jgi:hypothetical protein